MITLIIIQTLITFCPKERSLKEITIRVDPILKGKDRPETRQEKIGDILPKEIKVISIKSSFKLFRTHMELL
jgi:hypothetical protein